MQKKVLQPKMFLEYEYASKYNFIINSTLKLIKKPNMKICDVGGATGLLLNEIILKSKHVIDANILEVEEFYKNRIVNKDINFIQGSILDKTIKDNEFDIVVFRLVLHHIISNNLGNTKKIQTRALNEVFRITKNEGFVIFFEQINHSRLFSMLIYYLSKIFNKLKIKWAFFDIDNVIVHFLTFKDLKRNLNVYMKKYKFEFLKKEFNYMIFSLKWKFLFFMRKMGYIFLIIKVKKD